MSTEVHEGTLYVTRYAGPAVNGGDRMRWQFTLPSGNDQVWIGRDEALKLARAIISSASVESDNIDGDDEGLPA